LLNAVLLEVRGPGEKGEQLLFPEFKFQGLSASFPLPRGGRERELGGGGEGSGGAARGTVRSVRAAHNCKLQAQGQLQCECEQLASGRTQPEAVAAAAASYCYIALRLAENAFTQKSLSVKAVRVERGSMPRVRTVRFTWNQSHPTGKGCCKRCCKRCTYVRRGLYDHFTLFRA